MEEEGRGGKAGREKKVEWQIKEDLAKATGAGKVDK